MDTRHVSARPGTAVASLPLDEQLRALLDVRLAPIIAAPARDNRTRQSDATLPPEVSLPAELWPPLR
eukprot:5352157-Prymnesium_polylepis.1